MKAMLILLRHGQSVYNEEGLFTGWTDVALSGQGREEAKNAGSVLKAQGIYPDVCFTSWLKRAIDTAQIALKVMEWEHIDCIKSWKLNERHYGAWQQKKKEKIREEVGEVHFLSVRRGYDTAPPVLEAEDPRAAKYDLKYKDIDPNILPRSESLKETAARAQAYYEQKIVPELEEGKTVLLSAHGNSLRALVMMIEGLSAEEIVSVEIPTGKPLIYLFDEKNILTKKKFKIEN